MNHKIVLSILAGLFSLGVFTSILSLFAKLFYYPEFFYLAIFALLVVVCITFFKRKERYNI